MQGETGSKSILFYYDKVKNFAALCTKIRTIQIEMGLKFFNFTTSNRARLPCARKSTMRPVDARRFHVHLTNTGLEL